MASRLPDDLLHIVCGALSQQKDFDTLFHCACSGKQFAVPALANLYRMHNKAPITGSGLDDAVLTGEEKFTITVKWANLWHSIIRSCIGKTFLNYAQSIRKLDFQDLELLLDETLFWRNISGKFFDRDLRKLKSERVIKQSNKSITRLDANATANNIAKLVLQHTPMLEKLAGAFSSPEVIKGFLPYTPRLLRLRVFNGSALTSVGPHIEENCKDFAKIRIFLWQGNDVDHHCATLLSELPPQTLRAFGVLGGAKISAETFSALNCHAKSLLKLDLRSIEAEAMQYLSNIKDCTQIRSLNLEENQAATQDLEGRHNDVFLDMIEWLRNCYDLKSLTITNFISAPALLTPMLRERGVELDTLELEGYSLSGNHDFHQALALQTSLTSLYLRGEDSESRFDNDSLVDSLCQLVNLRDLRMTQVSANITEHHIRLLTECLPKLETLWIGGFRITDAIWPDIARLQNLRRVEFTADTRFTPDGIIDFILSLGPSYHGFQLSIMMQDVSCDISEDQQEVIKQTLASHLDGRFDFLLARGPDDEFVNSDEGSD